LTFSFGTEVFVDWYNHNCKKNINIRLYIYIDIDIAFVIRLYNNIMSCGYIAEIICWMSAFSTSLHLLNNLNLSLYCSLNVMGICYFKSWAVSSGPTFALNSFCSVFNDLKFGYPWIFTNSVYSIRVSWRFTMVDEIMALSGEINH